MRRCSSTHSVPETMNCSTSATDITSPATKPPPGALWPRMKKYTDTSTATGSTRRTSTAGTIR
ncbi:hypothetical protein D9M68_439510 [compost metagenome]